MLILLLIVVVSIVCVIRTTKQLIYSICEAIDQYNNQKIYHIMQSAQPIYIGTNIEHIDNYYDYRGNEPTPDLPAPLNTHRARLMLDRFRSAGYLDNTYGKPDGKSWAEMAILANVMGTALRLDPLWVPFEQMWSHPRLRNNYDGVLNTNSNAQDIALSMTELIKEL